MECNRKIIRQFKDKNNNRYIIYKKPNRHYELVKYNDKVGKTILTRKDDIYEFVKRMWIQGNIKELLEM